MDPELENKKLLLQIENATEEREQLIKENKLLTETLMLADAIKESQARQIEALKKRIQNGKGIKPDTTR